MELINLTPHKIVILDDDENIVLELESQGIARCEQKADERAPIVANGKVIKVVRMEYGKVTGLPDPVEGIGFVVSAMVLNALSSRVDIFAPGELVRDDQGVPIGCKGLSCNENYRGTSVKVEGAQVAVGVNNIQIGGSVGPGTVIGSGNVIAKNISGGNIDW